MQRDLGYQGTTKDLQRALAGATSRSLRIDVATAAKKGEFPKMLWEGADILDETLAKLERPVKRPVSFNEDRQFGLPPGPDITDVVYHRFDDRCFQIAVIGWSLAIAAGIASTAGGGPVTGILGGTATFFAIMHGLGC